MLDSMNQPTDKPDLPIYQPYPPRGIAVDSYIATNDWRAYRTVVLPEDILYVIPYNQQQSDQPLTANISDHASQPPIF